jgi:RimJ/RimL family protein N-acetyltransferase
VTYNLSGGDLVNSPKSSLRAVQIGDRSFLAEWSTDAEITRNTLGRRFPAQAEAIDSWIRESNSGLFPIRLAYIIEDHLPQGLVQLDQIDWVSRNAWLGIWLVPSSRGKGYGSTALREILSEASDEWNLRQVRLLVRSDNVVAQSLYEKSGFRFEGELGAAEFRQGQFISLRMFCLDLRTPEVS